jgi:hypothetical protein
VGKRQGVARCHPARCCDAGNNFERYAGCGKGPRLLTAATKDQRVAPLQPDNPAWRLLPQANEGLVDLLLGEGVVARALADKDALGVGRNERKYVARHQIVENDDLGVR